MVLSDIDDTEENFSTLQATIFADAQEEGQCQYDTTSLKQIPTDQTPRSKTQVYIRTTTIKRNMNTAIHKTVKKQSSTIKYSMIYQTMT